MPTTSKEPVDHPSTRPCECGEPIRQFCSYCPRCGTLLSPLPPDTLGWLADLDVKFVNLAEGEAVEFQSLGLTTTLTVLQMDGDRDSVLLRVKSFGHRPRQERLTARSSGFDYFDYTLDNKRIQITLLDIRCGKAWMMVHGCENSMHGFNGYLSFLSAYIADAGTDDGTQP